MIQKLGLDKQLSLQKNLITFNVGGRIMTNQLKTSTQVSDSNHLSCNITKAYKTNDLFVDKNPKLFQHLVNKLREKSTKDI